jgi:hypothetical protein
MSGPYEHHGSYQPHPTLMPRTPGALLYEALGGRAQAVQLRITEKLSRADVRELAVAIDEAVLWAVGSYAASVATHAAQREADLRELVKARKAAVQ